SQIEVTYWGRTISVETRGYYYFVEFLIRKAFHFIGFGLIGTLMYLLFRRLNWKFAALLASIATFFIACLDEYRQTFVEGRTGVFDDVLLDTAGAITFIYSLKILLFLKDLLLRKKKNAR
ncbi:MAG: VanZ family protein, partial [Lysinibacillus sp.]|nr:VanZ family protein [Lysinibacillus sp.]